jgi:hypothetical protein
MRISEHYSIATTPAELDGLIGVRAGGTELDRSPAICSGCGEPMLQLNGAFQTSDGLWMLSLTCANCDSLSSIIATEDQAATTYAVIDCLADSLEVAIEQLEHASMRDYVARFGAALESNAILPEDF